MGGIGPIHEAVHQVFVTPLRNAQARGLDDMGRGQTDVFHQQHFMIKALCIPDGHLQSQGLAKQCLPRAQLLRGARAALGVGVVQEHLRQARRSADLIDPRVGGFDQHCVARALSAEVEGIAATGVIHINVAAIQKQSLTLFCVTEGGVTAFFFAVIGFCFDNPGAEPQVADPMADDFAE